MSQKNCSTKKGRGETHMRHIIRSIACVLSLVIGINHPGWSLGLAARFGEIVVENAEIGRTYNLRETLKIPLGIENRSGGPIEVVIEFLQPPEKFLSPNYEPIPDPSWLKALPDKMKIGGGAQGFFDLLLTIPNDPSLNGRHFQATVKARTTDTGLFGLAIENKLRFSIGPGPEALKEEKRQKAMAQLDFDVSPKTLYVMEVEAGKKFDARKEQNKVIRVANYAPDLLPIQLTSAAWDERLYMPAGYEPIPDPSWISFKVSSKEIKGEEIAVFEPVINVPKDEKYRGKKFAGLIRTGLSTGFWLDAPVTIFITVK